MKVTANVILRNPKTGAVTVVNAGEEAPGWAESQIGDHLKGEGSTSKDEATGHAALKVSELREEIERRNEGREEVDWIPSDGNKADLVAALEADDGNN